MRRPLTFLVALCACLGLFGSGAALAKPLDGTYRGKTSQGFKAVVKVKGGVVQSVNLPWVGKCRDKRYKWGPIKRFTWTNDPKEPIEQSGNSFSDSGQATHDVKGEHSVSRGFMRGHFSGERVSGIQDIKVHVTYKGEKDYCHARIHWSAKLVGATAKAASATTYRGTTDQGRKAYLKVRNGEVTLVNVPWIFRKSNCTPHNGYSLGDGKPYRYESTESKPIVRNGDSFKAHRHEIFKVGAHGKATIDGRLSGKFSGRRVTGKSVMSATSNDALGHHTCKRTIHFSLKLVA